MKEKIEEAISELSRQEENYLLDTLSAKKGDIKTRADLKNYSFKCPYCQRMKPALEAVLLKTSLKLDSEKKKTGQIVKASQKILMICEECRTKLFPLPEEIETVEEK